MISNEMAFFRRDQNCSIARHDKPARCSGENKLLYLYFVS